MPDPTQAGEVASAIAEQFLDQWGLRWETTEAGLTEPITLYPHGAGSALAQVALATQIEDALRAYRLQALCCIHCGDLTRQESEVRTLCEDCYQAHVDQAVDEALEQAAQVAETHAMNCSYYGNKVTDPLKHESHSDAHDACHVSLDIAISVRALKQRKKPS